MKTTNPTTIELKNFVSSMEPWNGIDEEIERVSNTLGLKKDKTYDEYGMSIPLEKYILKTAGVSKNYSGCHGESVYDLLGQYGLQNFDDMDEEDMKVLVVMYNLFTITPFFKVGDIIKCNDPHAGLADSDHFRILEVSSESGSEGYTYKAEPLTAHAKKYCRQELDSKYMEFVGYEGQVKKGYELFVLVTV